MDQRINGPQSFITSMETTSGVTFDEAQVALVRKWLGHSHTTDDPRTIQVKSPRAQQGPMAIAPHRIHLIKPTNANNSLAAPASSEMDRISSDSSTGRRTPEHSKHINVPRTFKEASLLVDKFQHAAPRKDDMVADTVGQHVQLDSSSLQQEKWMGTPQEEVNA